MSTRSLTYVYSDHDWIVANKPLLCMYRQSDGYPEGHGKALAEFLAPFEIVNGITLDQNPSSAKRFANGMGCLAAQMVAHFKYGIGGIYLQFPDVVGNLTDGWQEYEYHVYKDRVEVYEVMTPTKNPLFSGSWESFAKWCEKPESQEQEESPLSIDDLRDALKKRVVAVEFTKADGSKRYMRCTLNPDYLPETLASNTSVVYQRDPDLFKVWDVDIKDWRSFRKERIVNLKAE